VIDTLLFVLVVFAFMGALSPEQASIVQAVLGLLGVVGLILLVVFNYRYVRAKGQSIGKRSIGIKVVRTDGSPVSVARVFWLRNVVTALISGIPFVGNLFSLVYSLFIFCDNRRCIHDLIADTIVIKA
jgi:uncharacterized RDD family membrane protein YckC